MSELQIAEQRYIDDPNPVNLAELERLLARDEYGQILDEDQRSVMIQQYIADLPQKAAPVTYGGGADMLGGGDIGIYGGTPTTDESAMDQYNDYMSIPSQVGRGVREALSDKQQDELNLWSTFNDEKELDQELASMGMPSLLPPREQQLSDIALAQSETMRNRVQAFQNMLNASPEYTSLSLPARAAVSRYMPEMDAQYVLSEAPSILGGRGAWGDNGLDPLAFSEFVASQGIGPGREGYMSIPSRIDKLNPQAWQYGRGQFGYNPAESAGSTGGVTEVRDPWTATDIAKGREFWANLDEETARNIARASVLSKVTPIARPAIGGREAQQWAKFQQHYPDVRPGAYALSTLKNPWGQFEQTKFSPSF